MGTIATPLSRVESVLGGNFTLRTDGYGATVLIVSSSPRVRHALSEALAERWSRVEWASGAESAKQLFSSNAIAACLCGFDLEDGTYKEIVRHAKRLLDEVPVIVVSTPNCPNEYGEYLGAMNAGAFDFLCHPYQLRELDRMLGLAVRSFHRSKFSHL